MRRTTRWGLPAVAALAAPSLSPAAPAVADPPVEHCHTLALTPEQVEDGETSEVICADEEPFLGRGSTQALVTHYSLTGGNGRSLTVWGTTCAYATISFVVTDPWNNDIKSTRHFLCGNAKHFVNNDFTGDHQLTTGSAGWLENLSTYMGGHVSSVGYG